MPRRIATWLTTSACGTQLSRIVAPALVFAATFVLQLLTSESQLSDENFQTLWMASAILRGEWPYRDFLEPGFPLQTAVSTVGQTLFGYRVLGEFFVSSAFIAAGATFTFVLSRRAAGSTRIALVVTLLAIGLLPRFYSYPKVFLYPLTIWLFWRYLDRPSLARATAIAATAAMAFLFRHDHGVYIGSAAMVLLVVAHHADGLRVVLQRVALCGLVGGLLLAPWLAMVQRYEGIPNYWASRVDRAQKAGLANIESPWFSIDDAAPPVTVPPVRSAVIPPGIVHEDKASTILYYVLWILPALVLVTLGFRGVRASSAAAIMPNEAPKLVAATVLIALANRGLLRNPEYVPDAAWPAAILAAWLLGRALRHRLTAVSALVLLGIATSAVVTLMDPADRVRESGLNEGVRGWLKETRALTARLLASPPIDGFVEPGQVSDRNRAVVRYLYECTRPDDRLLVVGSTPFDIPYYTERRFAGGTVFWVRDWLTSPEEQRRTLEMLRGQSVPFAISTRSDESVLRSFESHDQIAAYLAANYTAVAGLDGRLLIDTRRQPSGVYKPLDLPCLR